MRNNIIEALRRKKDFAPRVVFDIGGNVGQSAVEFAGAWPQARIYSFEPIPRTFALLQEATTEFPNVVTSRIAFGARSGVATMLARDTSPVNRIISRPTEEPTIEAQVSTIDAFCASENIPALEFVKIDTEGHDLKVLVGGANMLREQRIEFVQVECALSPDNRQHVSLDAFSGFLFPLGYRLFGLFDLEHRLGKTRLRGAGFGNAVFVKEP